MQAASIGRPEKARKRQNSRVLGWSLILGTTGVVAIAIGSARPRPAVILPEEVARATVPSRTDGTHPSVYATAGKQCGIAQLGRRALPVDENRTVDRFEVDLRYGTFVLRQTDLAVTDGVLYPLTRTYSSEDWGSPSHDHAFSLNSSHNWDIAPTGTRLAYTYLTLVLSDSDSLYFGRISAGSGYADAVYLHTETSTAYYKATIAWNGDGLDAAAHRRSGTAIS